MVVHCLGKAEVTSSSLVNSSKYTKQKVFIMWEIFGKPKTNAKKENRVESLHQLKLTTQIIDKSFSFYNLDYKCKNT